MTELTEYHEAKYAHEAAQANSEKDTAPYSYMLAEGKINEYVKIESAAQERHNVWALYDIRLQAESAMIDAAIASIKKYSRYGEYKAISEMRQKAPRFPKIYASLVEICEKHLAEEGM